MARPSLILLLITAIFARANFAGMVYGNETAERYLDPVAKRMGRQVK